MAQDKGNLQAIMKAVINLPPSWKVENVPTLRAATICLKTTMLLGVKRVNCADCYGNYSL